MILNMLEFKQMKNSGIKVSIAFAVVLIAGALLVRYNNSREERFNLAELVAIENTSEPVDIEAIMGTSKNEGTSSAQPDKPLTNTDMISRQLFADYLDLSASSQNNQKGLGYLANQYAQNILKQDTIPKKQITTTEINVVADSSEAKLAYSTKVFALRNKYTALARTTLDSQGTGGVLDINSIAVFGKQISEMYSNAAEEMIALPGVPVSLAETHVAIIKNYLESSEAMKKLSQLQNDPLLLYSALKTQSENSKREEELFIEVQTQAFSNGIIFGNDI